MCMAIYKPKGVQIAKEYLKNSFRENHDGAGFAIARNAEVKCFKGFFKFGDFWKAFKPYQNEAAVIHFRWATHGEKNGDNCHPFLVCGGNMAVVHNGIIDIKTDGKKSDTATFCELVIEPILKQGVSPKCGAFRYLIETSIGAGNKIVMLLRDGKAIIFNEKQGVWHNGAWFSNEGFKNSRPTFDWMFPEFKCQSPVKITHGERFPDYEPGGERDADEADRAYYKAHGFAESEIDEIIKGTSYDA